MWIAKTWGSSVSIGYCLTTDKATGVRSPIGQRIFLPASVSRPAMRPTQRHIQWIQGLTLGAKARVVRDSDHSPPSSDEVKNE
jgi:hypothetical protein